MKKILIDGKKISSKEQLFEVLKGQLQSDEFHGNNLDALYDVLTDHAEPVELEVVHPGDLREKLGEYADRFMRMFRGIQEQWEADQ
ncbi:MAG: barstar family protein [Eubacteriales bacterium]|nr:barstar family protein [Eubacteriales bacterium]